MYNKNYKALRKEIKEVKDKKISHVLGLEDNIVKMSILLKGMYGFSPYQNPKGIFFLTSAPSQVRFFLSL